MALRTSAFDAASVVDVTDQAMASLSTEAKGKVASGDLLVLTAAGKAGGRKYVLASFHGDTDGLATLPVLEAVHAVVLATNPNPNPHPNPHPHPQPQPHP